MRIVKIENKPIGDGYPTYIIAEIGGNFHTFEQGIKLIKSAVSHGVDAVKLQTFKAKNVVSKFATFDMPGVGGKKTQLEILKNLELDLSIQKKIFDYCKNKNITIFSTPSHKTDIDFLEENDVCAYKIGSDDLTNLQLIKQVSKMKRPTIISTGMSNLKEVKEAVNTFYSTGNRNLILLHCVSMYPAEPKFSNLLSIPEMKKSFKIPIGWSDHTKSIDICVAATAFGANLIEKHFTLSKKSKGPDHILSATSPELSEMVKKIRIVEDAKGTGIKKPAKCEERNRLDIRKSIVAAKKIPKGTKIVRNLLEIKRPSHGIPPKKINLIIGKKIIKEVKKDEFLKMEYLK